MNDECTDFMNFPAAARTPSCNMPVNSVDRVQQVINTLVQGMTAIEVEERLKEAAKKLRQGRASTKTDPILKPAASCTVSFPALSTLKSVSRFN